MRAVGRTDDAREAFVTWYGFSVVALSALESFGKVNRGLQRLSLQVQFVNTALGDH
jgi:hypothetical protein